METNFALLLGALLLTSSLPRVAARSKADAAEADASFTLAVKLDGAYNKGFSVCMLIRPSEPFNVEWMQGSLKISISGVLRQPDRDAYPLVLTMQQGFTDQVRTSMTWEPS